MESGLVSSRGEGACSRSAAQQTQNRTMRFTGRNAGACCAGQREQAHSHTGVNAVSATTPIPCGSEPARDEIAPVPEPNTPPESPKILLPTAPTYTPLSSHASLRLCLQLRQNPPACAPCPWVLLSSCHCPSVVGFSSPDDIRLHESHQLGIRLHSMVAVRMAPSGAPVLGMSPVY